MSSLLPLLLMFLCFCFASASGETFQAVKIRSLLPATRCTAPRGPAAGPNSLKVVHRQGPCSPSGGGDADPSLILGRDRIRVASIRQRLSGGGGATTTSDARLQASQVTLPSRRGTYLGSGNYVVTVGLGTPAKDQTVVFDTGSDLCWFQCGPCAGDCHPQQDALFDRTASSTYRSISCSSPLCSNLAAKGCVRSTDTCVYGVGYGDNSTTVGFLATETLTLTPPNVFPNFVFGCGQDNKGLFGRTAGLMGLSRSSYSLNSQASAAVGGDVFSYCLPTASSSAGHLTIGKGTYNALYTPMLSDSRIPSLYSVGLAGISVGGQPLPVSPAVFLSTGTIIDSGTVITRLPPAAYAAMRSAFRSRMSQYTPAPALSILDTCYDLSNAGSSVTFPTVTLHFQGGLDLRLPAEGVFFVVKLSQVCLAFAGEPGPGEVSIIGNVQQRTMEVVYDIGAKRIGFAAGACS